MNDYSDGAGLAVLAIFSFIWFLFAIAFYVIGSWFLMKIFDKAGVQGRWRAWVPVYNTMVFSKLGDLNPWLILIAIGASIVLGWIPVLGPIIGIAAFIVTLLAAWRVGLKLQKEAVWVVLYFFLSIVWLGILAFDKSRWNTAVAPAPWAGNGFLADRTNWAGIPAQTPAGGYAAAPGSAPGAYPPPAGYAAPAAAAPAGYAPPPATEPPAGYTPPPAASAPEPPSTPPSEPAPVPPTEPAPPVTPEPAPPVGPETPLSPEPPAAPQAPEDPNAPRA
jgi:hypothetical protein